MDLTTLSQTPLASLVVIVLGIVVLSVFRLLGNFFSRSNALVQSINEVTKSGAILSGGVNEVQKSTNLLIKSNEEFNRLLHEVDVKVNALSAAMTTIANQQQQIYGLLFGVTYRPSKLGRELSNESSEPSSDGKE